MNKKKSFSDDSMFIFRRISKSDSNLEFITGNKAFDEKNLDRSLKAYFKEDTAEGG